MTRLSWKIYAAFLLIVVAFLGLSTLFFVHGPPGVGPGPGAPGGARGSLRAGALLAEWAFPSDLDADATRERLAQLHRDLGASGAVFAADGRRIAEAGELVSRPRPTHDHSHWIRGGRRRGELALRLDDGRWAVFGMPRGPARSDPWLRALAALGLALAIGAYPLARGITRRIERLTDRVDALAEGDLGARVEVQGRDEVARLAHRFNRAAERIQALVDAQQTLLASASHELRSPLARLRMALELDEGLEPGLRAQAERDIAALDEAVEELLMGSRLGLVDATALHAELDFLALVAEEAAQFDVEGGAEVELSGEATALVGDPRSLRHMVRNLIRNAQSHAPGSPVEVVVSPVAEGGAVLSVGDRGPGIAPEERDRIFEPFARGANSIETPGVGLGLAIVRAVARHHRGDVRVEPREGGGSWFRVSLPGRAPQTHSQDSGARRQET